MFTHVNKPQNTQVWKVISFHGQQGPKIAIEGKNGNLARPMFNSTPNIDAVVKKYKELKKLGEKSIKLLDSVSVLSSLRILGFQPNYHQ